MSKGKKQKRVEVEYEVLPVAVDGNTEAEDVKLVTVRWGAIVIAAQIPEGDAQAAIDEHRENQDMIRELGDD